ncbi:hypothetical protein PFISCL1PPCAC_13434, partial [Pristionchus fissidentatus]
LILILMEIWTISTFVRLLRMNRKRLEAVNSFTLSERYQISENIRMLRIMLPIVWSHTSITVVAIAIYLITVASGMPHRYFSIFEVRIIFFNNSGIS